MVNKDLKEFLKFLKKENIINEYENLFDKIFDFSELLKLSKEDISTIVFNKELSAVRLYEIINKVKLDDTLIDKFIESDDSIKKYVIRVLVSDIEYKEDIIDSFMNGNNEDSVRYSYSLTTKEMFKNDENLRDYVRIISKCNKEVAYQIREFVENEKENNKEIPIEFLHLISTIENPEISDYLFRLYDLKGFNNINEYMVLSLSNDSENAKNAFIVITDDKLKTRDDMIFVALSLATADTPELSRKGLLEAYKYYDKDDLIEKVTRVLDGTVDGNDTLSLKDVLKDGNIDEILFSLSTIDNYSLINGNTKVKVKA